MTTETTPDEKLQLASALVEAAGAVDDAIQSVHSTVGQLMDAFKNIASFVAAENAELKFRLESLDK